MKKSVVLLITLALIVSISTLIYLGLEIVDRASKEVWQKRFLIQKGIFLKQVADILKKRASDINSSDGFDMLINIPIELNSKEIDIYIEFDSAAKGLNPNNFLKKVNKKMRINPDYVLLFDRILQSAEVLNKELFIAIIEDTLDKDLEERFPGSEIALYDKRFYQGRIENFDKFKKIIDRYILLTEDNSINHIEWESILGFYSNKIDINHISPLLVRYILPYTDDELIKKVFIDRVMSYKSIDELNLPKEDKDELKKFNISGFVPVLEGNLTINQNGKRGDMAFIYDIEKKKVLEIEKL